MLRVSYFLLSLLLPTACLGKESAELVRLFNETKALAHSGKAGAQFRLGEMYSKGEGTTKDHGQAAQWFRKAAEQGHLDAQLSLGLMHTTGEGVPQDPVQAAFWYGKAAEQGDAEVQFMLGLMYCHGHGVPKDRALAVFWWRKAAEQGLDKAQFNLGLMYRHGEGVRKDEIEACAWLNLSAPSLAKAESERDSLEKAMPTEARMRAQARTHELQRLIKERKVANGK